MFKPSSKLQRWVKHYNKKYFDGKLPEVQVGFNDEIPDDHGTQITVSLDYPPGHKIHQIHISPETHCSNRQLKLTLLHELVHLKLVPYSQHGKRFEAEMLVLASKGAFKDIW